MADIAYIQFTSRLKATSKEGIIAEASQIAVSADDATDIKTYIDSKVSEGGASSTDVTDLQKRVAAIEARLKLV